MTQVCAQVFVCNICAYEYVCEHVGKGVCVPSVHMSMCLCVCVFVCLCLGLYIYWHISNIRIDVLLNVFVNPVRLAYSCV